MLSSCYVAWKQCFRTWLDDGDKSQIANGGKYLSALVAIVTRVAFKNNSSQKWMTVFIASSTFATCYQLYWDVVVDWGLLQPKSLNPWLRDMLVLRQQSMYFISVVWCISSSSYVYSYLWVIEALLKVGCSRSGHQHYLATLLAVFSFALSGRSWCGRLRVCITGSLPPWFMEFFPVRLMFFHAFTCTSFQVCVVHDALHKEIWCSIL